MSLSGNSGGGFSALQRAQIIAVGENYTDEMIKNLGLTSVVNAINTLQGDVVTIMNDES